MNAIKVGNGQDGASELDPEPFSFNRLGDFLVICVLFDSGRFEAELSLTERAKSTVLDSSSPES